MARKCEASLTARPWAVRRDPEAWPNSERPNAADHCQILFGDDGDGGDTVIARFADYASDADARLCVAAPELLDVAERALAAVDGAAVREENGARFAGLRRMAGELRAAIAKARGEARP